MTISGLDARDAVVEYLEHQLLGPHGGKRESLDEPPQRRYLTGILFPIDVEEDPALDNEVKDEEPGAVGEDVPDDPIALSGQRLPSSIGLSFVLSDWSDLEVEVGAGQYIEAGKKAWLRSPLTHIARLRPPASPGRTHEVIWGGIASVDILWRRLEGGASLVTVALVNRRTIGAAGVVDPADCLFQVALSCRPVAADVLAYPNQSVLSADDEDEELKLLYRGVPTFAIGHGVAASWDRKGAMSASRVSTSFLPRHAIPSVRFELEDEDAPIHVLGLPFLARIDQDPATVTGDLHRFLDSYDAWAETLKAKATTLEMTMSGAAQRLLGRLATVQLRMRRGVKLLESDDTVRRSFALANEAMLEQILRTRGGVSSTRRHRDDPIPQPTLHAEDCSWRPFQLAFLLLTIEGVADHASDDREVVDLIWFPTGGGKTEAYLGLVAFTVFLRRLRDADAGAGTTVITRYTLRLLTAQQFQRAASLVCAAELIRRRHESDMGSTPVSIGLWVGGGTTPNTYAEAVEVLEKMQADEFTSVGFQVDLCPWCGTEIIPTDRVAHGYGVRADNDAFALYCPNSRCEFHIGLPVSSVDEAMYASPPTVLVGTVDKFARFAWSARPGSFLGSPAEAGPSLIIQDEFHLISGPLGTVVGVYEAAFDVVLRQRGVVPKIVASTATIRRAADQARGVFGRDVSLFPPSGLSADNSYFVRFDAHSPGRLYVGAMSQGHTPLTAAVHVSAAMLQAPIELPLDDAAKDAFWTLVAYHNSLRELGKTVTLAHDDIPARASVIAEADDNVRALHDDSIMELTSNIPAIKIPERLERLGQKRLEPGAVSLAACTNMLSVGVDVPRLGLMLMVGQPKTTAEYIQASSRVGRSSPGLVVTLYSPAKPRDRSHFESFVPYHSALYRAVEPTSVTPFSVPSRERALHAALVILARHARGWAENSAAGAFERSDPAWRSVVTALLDRIKVTDPDELAASRGHVEQLEDQWETLRDTATEQLQYWFAGKQKPSLLRKYGARPPGWETLDSMRNVDVEVALVVRGEVDA